MTLAAKIVELSPRNGAATADKDGDDWDAFDGTE
jgi:hypothetical protein